MKITNKKNDSFITLKAVKINTIKNDKYKSFINKDGQINIVDSESTIYYVVDKKVESNYYLNKKIEELVSKLNYSLNVEIDSFSILNDNVFNIANSFVTNWVLKNTKRFSMKKENKFEANDLSLISSAKNINDKLSYWVDNAELVCWARDLQDMPPNVATSEFVADEIVKKAKEYKNVKVKVLNREQIQKENLNLLLAVNAASCNEPRVVILEYKNSSDDVTAIVGKGICFDTGGYNLKPSSSMENMKFDMSGSASAAATIFGLAKSEAKANVVAFCMLTDNKIGSKGTVPESIVKTINGVTVEVSDTDAEGRLVLADGIAFAQAKYKVKTIIDIATLTGSVVRAIGKYYSGIFLNKKNLFDNISKIADQNFEQVWHMPLEKFHLDALYDATKIADLASCAAIGVPDASVAAAFLNYFVKDNVNYIHIDVAGTADADHLGKGPMIRTLVDYLSNIK